MYDPKDYTVGWICAISTEHIAAQAFLDEEHEGPEYVSSNDNNDYTLGKIGKHNVVIAVLPDGEYGISSAVSVAKDMLHSFPNVRIGLMVGIGGGAPSPKHDIRLGDIVVSAPCNGKSGVFQYDFGKTIQDQNFRPTGFLNQPPTALRTAVSGLKSQYKRKGHQLEEAINGILEKEPRLWKEYKRPDPGSDRLYQSRFTHTLDNEASCAVVCGDDPSHLILRHERTEGEDNPAIHYGLIASANQLMKDASIRDRLAAEKDVLCFEMEAAGLINHFPCLVIRGICDYADSHKNKDWQGYAAMTAAAYAKDLLYRIAPNRVEAEKRISEILPVVLDTVSRTGANVEAMSSRLTRKEDLEVLDWLTQIDYGPQQSDYIRRRQPGTGQWLLESVEYRDWLKSNKQTLFCPGIPGAGKTILTAVVTNDLTKQCLDDQTIGLAYIYCNFRRKDDQKAEDLLASILKQLSQCQSSLPESVKELYKRHKDRRTRPSLDELSTALQFVLVTYSRVFFVVDALDECQASDGCRKVFLSQLFDLQKKCLVNIFATARPIPEIIEKFNGITLEIRAHESDVQKYLEGCISQAESKFLKEHKEEIKSRITEIADGMFLLAQLHFDSIKTKKTFKKVKETLTNLSAGPEAYTRAYKDAMGRIEGQDGDALDLAMDVLLWITCAKRQLTTSELQHALAVERGAPELDKENIPQVEDMVSVCAGLVVVDEESNIIRLVHYTTQDYFEARKKYWFPDAKSKLTMICVTYLSFNTFEKGPCLTDEEFEARMQKNSLYDYAARNWGYHARAATAKLDQLILDLLENDAKVSASSQALMASKVYSGYIDHVPKQITALHLTAYFGLNEAASTLLRHGRHPDLKDSGGQTPLLWAARNGHDSVVKLLLETGKVDADSKDTLFGRTPLSWAAEKGHDGVVNLLLKTGKVNVDSKDTRFAKTPLSWATRNGHYGVVNLLLKTGKVDADSKDTRYGQTPLSWAARNGHDGVVKLLLETGKVDADSKDTLFGRTPLSWAARNGHDGIVKLLFETGKVNADSKDTVSGQTPLSWAAEKGHDSIVKLLLKIGKVDANSKSIFGQTPLLWAVEKGHDRIVKLLLETGKIDANSKSLFGRTPLSWAAEKGHDGVVRLLLETGKIDADSKDIRYGQTPLSWAARNGHNGIVKLLLETDKVDANLKDTLFGRAPLSWAAEKGHDGVVELLLKTGKVDSNSKDTRYGQTPLSWATRNGHDGVVKLLRNHQQRKL